MTATATKKNELFIMNRVEIKYPVSTIVYRVRSGEKTYSVTLHEDGTAGCYDDHDQECPGHKYHHHAGHDCKHVQLAENAEFDREHSAWKEAHGISDKPMTREQYNHEFDPDGINQMLSGMAGIVDRLHARLAANEQIAEVA